MNLYTHPQLCGRKSGRIRIPPPKAKDRIRKLYEGTWRQRYPRLQLLTVDDLLKGKKIDMPDIHLGADITHKKAPEVRS
jgi:hypothetical protein